MKKTVVKVFYSGASIFFSKFAALCATMYLVRKLDGNIFGRYSYIYATIIMFQSVASMSLGSTATKQVSIGVGEKNNSNIFGIFATNVLAATAFSILFAILADLDFFKLGKFSKIELIASICVLFFGAVSSVCKGIVIGGQRVNKLATINFSVTLFYLPVLFISVESFGYNGALWSLVLYYVADFALAALMANSIVNFREITLTKIFCKSSYKIIYSFGAPSALSGLIVLFLPWMALKAINQGTGGVEQVGLFSVANQWRMLLLLIPAVTDLIMVPKLNEAAIKKKNSVKYIILNNFYISSGIGLLVLCVVMLLSEKILNYYGDRFVNSGQAFIIMMVSGYLYVVNSVVGQFISSVGNMWHGFAINLVWGLIFGFGVLFYVRDFDSLAKCYFLSYVVHGFVQACYFFKNKSNYGF